MSDLPGADLEDDDAAPLTDLSIDEDEEDDDDILIDDDDDDEDDALSDAEPDE